MHDTVKEVSCRLLITAALFAAGLRAGEPPAGYYTIRCGIESMRDSLMDSLRSSPYGQWTAVDAESPAAVLAPDWEGAPALHLFVIAQPHDSARACIQIVTVLKSSRGTAPVYEAVAIDRHDLALAKVGKMLAGAPILMAVTKSVTRGSREFEVDRGAEDGLAKGDLALPLDAALGLAHLDGWYQLTPATRHTSRARFVTASHREQSLPQDIPAGQQFVRVSERAFPTGTLDVVVLDQEAQLPIENINILFRYGKDFQVPGDRQAREAWQSLRPLGQTTSSGKLELRKLIRQGVPFCLAAWCPEGLYEPDVLRELTVPYGRSTPKEVTLQLASRVCSIRVATNKVADIFLNGHYKGDTSKGELLLELDARLAANAFVQAEREGCVPALRRLSGDEEEVHLRLVPDAQAQLQAAMRERLGVEFYREVGRLEAKLHSGDPDEKRTARDERETFVADLRKFIPHFIERAEQALRAESESRPHPQRFRIMLLLIDILLYVGDEPSAQEVLFGCLDSWDAFTLRGTGREDRELLDWVGTATENLGAVEKTVTSLLPPSGRRESGGIDRFRASYVLGLLLSRLGAAKTGELKTRCTEAALKCFAYLYLQRIEVPDGWQFCLLSNLLRLTGQAGGGLPIELSLEAIRDEFAILAGKLEAPPYASVLPEWKQREIQETVKELLSPGARRRPRGGNPRPR